MFLPGELWPNNTLNFDHVRSYEKRSVYGKMGLRRELHYGVTMADEGLRPISPLKLKLPPPPSSRRFQTSQKTLFSLVMFI